MAGFHAELVKATPVENPTAGVMLVPRRADFNRFYAGEPSPERLKQSLLAAAFGQPEAQFELYDKMIEVSAHIRCESDKRRMAVTGLDWDVESASIVLEGDLGESETELADEIATHVRRVLRRVKGMSGALCHAIEAVGRGVAAVEVEWAKTPLGMVPIALHPVPAFRLRYDYDDPWRLRIMMGEHDTVGIPVDELPPGKFIVHAPRIIGGSAIRGGLFRPAMFWWMAGSYGIRFLIDALEIFGQPFRTVTFSATASAQVKQSMLDMLDTMARSAAGIFPEGSNFQVHEAGVTGNAKWPQMQLVDLANAEISKLFVGATLMTQVGEAGGNRALGEVQDEIRQDIRDDDIAAESDTWSEQLVRWIVAMSPYAAKGGMDLLPRFRRVVPEPLDDKADAELLDRAVNRWGMKVPVSHAVERFGIPVIEGQDPDESLPGAPSIGDDFSQGLSQDLTISNAEQVSAARRKLQELVRRRRSPAARLSTWLFAAIALSAAHTSNVVAAVNAFIEKRRTLEAALADLPEVFDQFPTDEMQGLQEHFLIASKLAGMAEANERLDRRGRGRRSANSDVAVNAEIDFGRIPFEAAIEAMRDRIGLTPDEFEALEAEARSRAWRVAGVHDMGVLATIHQALVKSVANGETSRDFRNRLPAMVEAAGWSGENPWHADLVHFQNFMMAHAAGRYAEYQEFGAAGWRFVANGDSCPICAPVVGKVFALSDRKYFPPLHFWCDCEDEVVFDGEVDTFDSEAAVKNPALAEALKKKSAFKWDPAAYANTEPVRLGGFPEDLRPVFKKFAEGRGWEVSE